MTFSFDSKKGTIKFVGEVPVGTWLSIGWGWHMFDTDMFLMQAYPDIKNSSLSDLWSTHNVTPTNDAINDYTGISIKPDSTRNMQIFTSHRLLDTGDDFDFQIPLDTELKICFAVNTKTPNFEVNSDWGLFKIKVNSDETINLWAVDTGHNRLLTHGIIM